MDIGHTMVTQNVYISVQIGSLSRYISHGKIHEINTWQCHIQTGCVYVTPLCYKQGYLPCIVITFQKDHRTTIKPSKENRSSLG